MSNFLAISTVTATMKYIVTRVLNTDFSSASITMARPDTTAVAGGPRTNIYLYQVTPNPALRNSDLPTRRSDGTLVTKPQAALDLHYLFSFYGDDAYLEPQRLLGSLVRTLHSQPVVSRDEINQAVTAAVASDPNFAFLKASDLANQCELVRFTPVPVNLEELSKIWSIFYQVPYALSAVYQASVVLIESEDAPQSALPVSGRTVVTVPFRAPVVDQVISQAGAALPILSTSTLLVQGNGLLADVTLVRTGQFVVTPQTVTDTSITLPVPPGLAAGVQELQVIQQFQMGIPPQPHSGFESNVAAFVLRPVITLPAEAAGHVTFTVAPMARSGQRLILLLNEATVPAPPLPAAYSFSLAPLPADTTTLDFTIAGVKGGGTVYFIRVRVDGAESPLDLNPASLTFGPTVTVP